MFGVATKPQDDVFVFPASFSQQRLWFLDRWESGSTAYHEPFAYRLRGRLDHSALEQAVAAIVARHEALRTSFSTEEGALVQLVQPAAPITIPVEDVTACAGDHASIQRRMLAEVHRPFDLSAAPMLRARLFLVAPDDHILLVTMHHVACDGWSVVLFFRELQAFYAAARRGQATSLPELPIQFADYSVWQREWFQGDELQRQAGYWKRQLADLSVLELPTDRPRPPRQTYHGARRPFSVPASLTRALKTVAQRENVTLFMTLTAAFQVLLHRYSGQEDIALGTPTAGRDRAELEGLIGCFVNMLVMRGDVSGRPTFAQLLKRTRQVALDAYAHPDLPFEQLVELVQAQRDVSRSPLFQVMFAMQAPAAPVALDGLEVSPVRIDIDTSKFDLGLFLGEAGDELSGAFEYNTDLFDAATIDRLIGHFVVLLDGLVAHADVPIGELPLLTEPERAELLVDWNRTDADYPRAMTVAELVEAQAARTPSAVAVGYEDRTLTYESLNARANLLAETLRGLGVGPSVLVGVCLERSLDMVAGLLAIMKAGGTYVPLDPAFPAERLAFMLEDSRAAVLLTQTKLQGLVPTDDVKVICLDTLELPDTASSANCPSLTEADDLAYVLYTSGSTGKPKGVEISHAALTNFLWAMRDAPGCGETDVLLAVTTLSFDIAGLELYLPLITGGRLELTSRATAADGRRLKECIARVQPTMFQATPATWRMLIDAGWTGTPQMKALIGGEALPADLVAPLLSRVASLWNMYGPTETTIWSSIQQIDGAGDITVGRPIANTTFYILDPALRPVPIGVPGELFIGGDGLARGYRGRADLTAERFVPDPFSHKAGARIYRTGDLARYRNDGRVVHLGRLDHQVKVRGFRIELGEIETALAKHPAVAQAVVIVRSDRPGDATLAGYVIQAPGEPVTAAVLKQHLRTTLPEYMVPQQIVTLDAFPLTPNGKIDRKRLPAPEVGQEASEGFVAPRTPAEETLAQIWTTLLGVARVGIHDDFFELGGHSLRAVEVMVRITETLKVEVPLQVLFEATTVAKLADRICDLTGLARAIEEPMQAPPSELVPARDPQTPTEWRLAAIWEQVLGVAPGATDNFLVLQASSDLVDVMLSETACHFGKAADGLSRSAFLEAPTIEAMARVLDAGSEPPSKIVVCMQPRGLKRPLFLIHAGSGYVFFYRALTARLGLDRPAYAVRAETDSDNLGRPFDKSQSTEELAARYIKELKTIQPHGPYSLGGACYGGLIAFEMAHQLRAQGEEVTDPILLFGAYVKNNPHAQAGQPASVTVAADQDSAAPAGPAQLQRMKRYLDWAMRLVEVYRPRVYSGRIVLFKAADGQDAEPMWAGLADGGMDVHSMPGVNLEMMGEPVVGETAALVQGYLD